MAKKDAVKADDAVQSGPEFTVRDAKTGRFLAVRGAGSMKGSKLLIRKGVDLTKPIAEQALRARSGKRAG